MVSEQYVALCDAPASRDLYYENRAWQALREHVQRAVKQEGESLLQGGITWQITTEQIRSFQTFVTMAF